MSEMIGIKGKSVYERILVALDGSKLAEAVLPYVEEIAGAFGSQVTLIHVCPPEEGHFTHMHEIYMEHMRHNLVHKLEGKPARVESVILEGAPQEEILNYAERQNFSLIALSAHGRSGIGRWVLGSISDKIIRATKIPLMLIHSRAIEAPKPADKSILVPLDGSTTGEAALPYAETIAQTMKKEIILLRVMEPMVFTGNVTGESATYSERLVQAEWKAAEDYLGNIARRLQEKKVTSRTYIRQGSPPTEIARLIAEQGIGLVAMSTHGRSGIIRWVLGSVTERIVRAVDIPVLVVRAQAAPPKTS